MHDLITVVYEDAELLVINKPAGLVCHPTKGDEYSSVISRVRLYLGEGLRPQLVNRLDRETSGVLVIAKSADAARGLRRLWGGRQVLKEYDAIVHGHPAAGAGIIAASLGKDERSRVAVKDCVREDGAPAITEYTVRHQFVRATDACPAAAFSLLSVVPRTGRKHQIRIHLAHIGHPIVGDKLYGGDEDIYLALVEDRLTPEQQSRLILPYQALHASRVEFTWRGRRETFSAAPESWFSEFSRAAEAVMTSPL